MATETRKLDNLESLVRQYRGLTHGFECECPECRWLLKGLASDDYLPKYIPEGRVSR